MSRGDRYDAVVVGGGPAGLASAIALRARGLSVVVCDGRRPPIDKACGEGLMPGGIPALAALGVDVAALRARPFRGIRYVSADDPGAPAAEAAFLEGPGLGIRRTVLHEALAARAAEAGAELRWGVAVTGLRGDGVATGVETGVDTGVETGLETGVDTAAGPVRATWVIGADGLHSKVRAWAGMDTRQDGRRTRRGGFSERSERNPPDGRDGRKRFGVRRHYRIAPWSPWVEVHWADGIEAYVTPVASDEVGIALTGRTGDVAYDEAIARFPELAARVAGVPVTSALRGAGPFRTPVREVVRGRVALVGDASGYLDPITGEGLALGFREAVALADAIAAGTVGAYARVHRALLRDYWAMTSFLLWIQRRPWLRRRVIRTLAASPEVFSRILAINNGTLPVTAVGVGGALRLARGLV